MTHGPPQLDGLARSARQWSADGKTFDWIVERLRRKHPDWPLFAVASWLRWIGIGE